MANQAGAGRPQHFSAWCKEKLTWIKPTVIDPTVKQKLILSPIEDSKECLKIPVRADGSEYFLLENRKKTGFDTSLPAEGLLIWRVIGNRPVLEESHGVGGAAGPRSFLSSVPFPSAANDSFTPYTTPSSRSQLGGGLQVYITNIRRLPDGRITLQVGYEFPVNPSAARGVATNRDTHDPHLLHAARVLLRAPGVRVPGPAASAVG